MTKSMQADLFFQICIKDFAADFGIQDPAQLEPQKREIIPESVEIDTVVSFPDDFSFTTLQDRIFPFWGKVNVIEYKGRNDRLTPMHICKYGLTEPGLMTTYLLSKKRKDRKERQPLSQEAAKAQLERLVALGAKHSCCNTILSTVDPVGVRQGCRFEPVDTYEHLTGALYHRTIWEDDFVGNIAAYLVVLNDLPVHPKNAPLLLLSTGKKQVEFCEWLLDTHEEMSLQRKQLYLLYLTGYHLVKNEEVVRKMWDKIEQETNHDRFLMELMAEKRDRGEFFREMSTVLLKTDSPIEIAQAALQVDSPMEMGLKIFQTEEQVERLLELIRKRNLEKTKA